MSPDILPGPFQLLNLAGRWARHIYPVGNNESDPHYSSILIYAFIQKVECPLFSPRYAVAWSAWLGRSSPWPSHSFFESEDFYPMLSKLHDGSHLILSDSHPICLKAVDRLNRQENELGEEICHIPEEHVL